MSSKNQSLLIRKRNFRLKPIKGSKNSIGTKLLKKKPITRVGETGNFIIDYDSTEGLILMYGKEAPTSHGFKLGLNENETTAVSHYLKQAKTFFPK